METRKLIKSGPSTLVVALPKKWTEFNRLAKGDTIGVENSGNKLIFSPLGKNNEKNESEIIELDKNNRNHLELLLYSAFYSEKKEIIIKNTSGDELQKIMKIIKKINYLKLEERKQDTLKFVFIVDPRIIDIKKEISSTPQRFQSFFELFLNKDSTILEINSEYEQLVSHIILMLKIIKIRFLDYDRNELLQYKQQIDSYYFLLKTGKEFILLHNNQRITKIEIKKIIKVCLENLKTMGLCLEKKDIEEIFKIQEQIQGERYKIIDKIKTSKDKTDCLIYLLVNDIYKIIESIGYAFINNR